MKRRAILLLVLLNLLLAGAVAVLPAGTQVIPLGLFDCCKSEGAPEPYCCWRCCWFTFDCLDDGDCRGAREP